MDKLIIFMLGAIFFCIILTVIISIYNSYSLEKECEHGCQSLSMELWKSQPTTFFGNNECWCKTIENEIKQVW